MASVNARNGQLFFDFRYLGQRCREYTKLADTPQHRKTMQSVLDKIVAEIMLGTFNYGKYFPGSKNADKFGGIQHSTGSDQQRDSSPLFRDFVETWVSELQIAWRRSHADNVRSTLKCHLLPYFGDKRVSCITKADVLSFRSQLAKVNGRNGNASLSARTINRIIQILGQILGEAADRFEFNNPVDNVKRLKQKRVDINPFSLTEAQSLIAAIRSDYRDYLIVRMFTGLRTGEANGLQWQYVDFERNQILIRETIVRGDVEYTKTDGAQREVDMSAPVREALMRMAAISRGKSKFVFCNSEGEPIDLNNFTKRVWYPLLRHLGLPLRRPYQMRHTAATLWLAAGENPEWVARQLGHTSTEMLFKTYSRFIPNLTRRDGSAMNNMLAAALSKGIKEDGHASA